MLKRVLLSPGPRNPNSHFNRLITPLFKIRFFHAAPVSV